MAGPVSRVLSFESVIPAGFRLELGTNRADELVSLQQVRGRSLCAGRTLLIRVCSVISGWLDVLSLEHSAVSLMVGAWSDFGSSSAKTEPNLGPFHASEF